MEQPSNSSFKLSGHLSLRPFGCDTEADYVYLDDEPLVKLLEQWSGSSVTLYYTMTETQMSFEEAAPIDIGHCFGKADIRLKEYFGDYTGYLYTDQDLMIGTHNLLLDLQRSVSNAITLYLNLELHLN